jgi:hypothetical protein
VLWWLVGCGSAPLVPVDAGRLPSRSAEVYRFVAVGDAGHPGAVHDRVRDAVATTCSARGCDLVVLLGDNLYPEGPERDDDPRFDQVIADYFPIAPVAMVLGNHDYGPGGRHPEVADRELRWAAKRPEIVASGRVWTARGGPAELVGIDTTRAFWGGEADQVAWLATLPPASGWRVLVAHHPWRSEGPHGNAGAYEGWPGIPWLSGAAVARLYDRGVCGRFDLALAGHDHILAHLPGPCGEMLAIAGVGSSPTQVVDRADDALFAAAVPGFVWVELGETGTVAWMGADGRELHRATLPSPDRAPTE